MPSSGSTRFTVTANQQLSELQLNYQNCVEHIDNSGLQESVEHAKIIRDAVVTYNGATDILQLPLSKETSWARRYLESVLPRLFEALREKDYRTLSSLSSSIQHILDALVRNDISIFTPFRNIPSLANNDSKKVDNNLKENLQNEKSIGKESVQPGLPLARSISNYDMDSSPRLSLRRTALENSKHVVPFFNSLQTRQKIVLILYVITVLGAIAASVIITIQFVDEVKDPSGLIQSTTNSTYRAPVVTVCLSQPGIPFSRLQLFNFTDADGVVHEGPGASGPYEDLVSKDFSSTVEHFWINPFNEDCDAIVGDFFPFNVTSLNRFGSGEQDTSCRQCYRVGYKKDAYYKSTGFRNSSILSVFIDTVFMECTQGLFGLSADSMNFLHNSVFNLRIEMVSSKFLSKSVNLDLGLSDVEQLSSEQLCNLFYLSYFPKLLNRSDPSVDVRYHYNGSVWSEVGRGPYLRARSKGGFPSISLEFYVEGLSSAIPNVINNSSDMVLVGPNTQSFITFQHVVVFGADRFDVSASQSTLVKTELIVDYGYWFAYLINYNFNRFVTDEWYQESTYPASQWLVDVLGYLGLFTGVSVFSLLLLPILKAVHQRDQAKFKNTRPEGYVWSRHRRMLHGIIDEDEGVLKEAGNTTQAIILPGYNV